MKDTVIVFINNYKLFVGDYYQDKVKQVKFKSQDYWEVFEGEDIKDFLEYMNYPLAYKSFKGSNLKFYFNNPLMYNYIYDVKEKLKECEAFGIGPLQRLILNVVKIKEEITLPLVVECLESQWRIDENWEMQVTEDQEVDLGITIEELCAYVIAHDQDVQTIESTLTHFICFSPASIREALLLKEKYKYLEVDNQLMRCAQDGEILDSQQEFLAYEQIVYKMFGKQDKKILRKMTPQAGRFVSMRQPSQEYWVKKNEVIGIIAPMHEMSDQTIKWFKDNID